MTRESPRRVAQEKLVAYQEAGLTELVRHVGEAVDRFRANELDAFEVDQVLFHYGRAAKELWKFCNLSDVEFAGHLSLTMRRSTGGNAEHRGGGDDSTGVFEPGMSGNPLVQWGLPARLNGLLSFRDPQLLPLTLTAKNRCWFFGS